MPDTPSHDFTVRAKFSPPPSPGDPLWSEGGNPRQFAQEMRTRAYTLLVERWSASPGIPGTILIPHTDAWQKHFDQVTAGGKWLKRQVPTVHLDVVLATDLDHIVGTITEARSGYELPLDSSKPYTLEFAAKPSEIPVPGSFAGPVLRVGYLMWLGRSIKAALRGLDKAPLPEISAIAPPVVSTERRTLVAIAHEMLDAQQGLVKSLGYDIPWASESEMLYREIPNWLETLGDELRLDLKTALESTDEARRLEAIERLRAAASAEEQVFTTSDRDLAFNPHHRQQFYLGDLAKRRWIFDSLLLAEWEHRLAHGLPTPSLGGWSDVRSGLSDFTIRAKVKDVLLRDALPQELWLQVDVINSDRTRSTPEYRRAVSALRCWAERQGCMMDDQNLVYQYNYKYPGHTFDVYAVMDQHRAYAGGDAPWLTFWGGAEQEAAIAGRLKHLLDELGKSGDPNVAVLRQGFQATNWDMAVVSLRNQAGERGIFRSLSGTDVTTPGG